MSEIEKRSDVEDGPRDAKFWHLQLRQEDKEFKGWRTRAEETVDRYRDEERKGGRKFNILWANIETLKPATFSKSPKPDVRRRYLDADPLSREVAETLERALEFSIDDYDFERVMMKARDDFLLPGRGQVRIRYKPIRDIQRPELTQVEAGFQIPEHQDPMSMDGMGGPSMIPTFREAYMLNGEEVEPDGEDDEGPYIDTKIDETVRCEYVYWKDYRESPARTWEDVWWVAFGHDMTYDDLVENFGEKVAKALPKAKEESEDKVSDGMQRTRVWEVWDRDERKLVFVCEEHPFILKEEEDPLNLKGFFPCPEPVVLVGTTDNRVPIPEFTMYQDQCADIDDFTDRISSLTKAIKANGAAPASLKLGELLTAKDGTIQQIVDWEAVAQHGGLQNAIQWVPIEQMANVLGVLVQQRDLVKHEIYEVTGLSDILRGDSKASETATAQRIKGTAGASRMQPRQRPMERFARDVLRLKAEVFSEHYDKETLTRMTGREVTDEMMSLMRDDMMRRFRIDVETDSTVQPDADTDKQQTIEFVTAVMQMLQNSAQMPPMLMPLVGEMLKFAVRRFKVGRELEEKIDETIQMASQPQQPQPDPEMQKAEAEMKLKQQEAEADIMLQREKMAAETQLEGVRLSNEMALEDKRFELEVEKALGSAALEAYKARQATRMSANG